MTGIATAVGAGITALVQTLSKRGEEHSEAADQLVSMGMSVADRLAKENEGLDKDNKKLRSNLSMLTRVIDDVIGELDGPPDAVERLRRASEGVKFGVL